MGGERERLFSPSATLCFYTMLEAKGSVISKTQQDLVQPLWKSVHSLQVSRWPSCACPDLHPAVSTLPCPAQEAGVQAVTADSLAP